MPLVAGRDWPGAPVQSRPWHEVPSPRGHRADQRPGQGAREAQGAGHGRPVGGSLAGVGRAGAGVARGGQRGAVDEARRSPEGCRGRSAARGLVRPGCRRAGQAGVVRVAARRVKVAGGAVVLAPLTTSWWWHGHRRRRRSRVSQAPGRPGAGGGTGPSRIQERAAEAGAE